MFLAIALMVPVSCMAAGLPKTRVAILSDWTRIDDSYYRVVRIFYPKSDINYSDCIETYGGDHIKTGLSCYFNNWPTK
jgi:hypothetical protein